MAKFEVREVFRLPTRREFVLAGHVVEGTLVSGMTALIWLDSQLFWGLLVEAVERIDRVSSGESFVGLLVNEQDEGDAEVCADFCPPGTVIEVKDAA